MKKLVSCLLCFVLSLGLFTPVMAEEPVVLSLFVDEPWWPYTSWDGGMPQWMTEQTGVTFDVTVAADSTQLPMMVASDGLPDVIVSTQMNLLSNSDICYSWDELIDQYYPEMTIHPAYKFVNSAADGKVYSILCGWSAEYEYEKYPTVSPEGTGLTVRKDILEAVLADNNLESIVTIDDLEACMASCKKLYPDVLPYLIYDSADPVRPFQALCGAGQSGLVDVDGKAELSIYDPHLEDALLMMNKWLRNGWLLGDNLSWTGSVPNEWVMSGKVFMVGGLSSGTQVLNNACREAEVDYTYMPLTTLRVDGAAEFITSCGWRGMFVSRNCKDPEAAIKAILFMYSKDTGYSMLWGIEGEDWNWNEDKTEAVLNWSLMDPIVSEKQFLWAWMSHDGISNNMQYMNDPATREALKWVASIAVRNPVLGKVFNMLDSESDEFVVYQSLQELETNYTARIVQAATEEEAKALYNEMIETANKLGGQSVNDWANELYPQMREAYEAVRYIGEDGWYK